MTILEPNAAGIDVHSDMHMVCVNADRLTPSDTTQVRGLPTNVRRFGANTCDLIAIAEWLKSCGVTTVAMESTGVYCVPLFELLESAWFRGLVGRTRPALPLRCATKDRCARRAVD